MMVCAYLYGGMSATDVSGSGVSIPARRAGRMAFVWKRISVTRDGYELLSLWSTEKLMERWLPYK
jgi:hypothetical protein